MATTKKPVKSTYPGATVDRLPPAGLPIYVPVVPKAVTIVSVPAWLTERTSEPWLTEDTGLPWFTEV